MSKISPKEYNHRISKTELLSISLIESNVKLEKGKLPGGLELKIEDETSYKNTKKGFADALHQYHVEATLKKKPFFEIMVKFCIELQCETPIDKEFFDIFSKVTLPRMTFPYLREFVSNVTGRMNVPPVTLPMIRRF